MQFSFTIVAVIASTTYALPSCPSSPAKASPSPNPAFKAPAVSISSMLGSGPSSTCTWEFVLTCADQAVEASATCLKPLAEACFNSLGKRQFIKACFEEKSDSNVAPVFNASVFYGVCNAQGVEIHA
ncbi:hypothetical protein LTR70_008141 [Exophiala xenobiotica]|uniref:Uncharacterized protein n=1 Tax=Lithohypha guttulata TaxID=1690604 RepID=A0ABR0JTL4_9EURO|nr:hypothetical protein LTR24_010534 [Lithohypha guttulata]KAK5312543.1 hypothetical protein LTR70_008141 [Exophiala xenobiotica]